MSRPASQVRSALRAVFGSTGQAVGELAGADAVLRTSLALSRRVGFVAVAGGSGTTSVTTSVASLLAHRRSGMVLGVDAAGGQYGIVRQVAGPDGGGDADADAERRRVARTAAEARQGLSRSETGLHLLDLAARTRYPSSPTDWAAAVGPIARFFDLVLTDWGVRPPTVDLEAVANTGHLLVVVGRTDRHAATAAAAAVDALQRSAPSPARLLLALVDVGRTPDRMAGRLRDALGVPVHVLPHERARATRLTPHARGFSAATRTAHIELATAVMGEAVTSQTSADRRPTGAGRRAVAPA